MGGELWLYGLGSVALVSIVSLIGVLSIALNAKIMHKIIFILVSLSVGALFGDVFFHLLPELFSEVSAVLAGVSVLSGIVAFFILEKFLRWYHLHDLEEDEGAHISPHVGYINIVADGLHNFIDGIFIAVSYLVAIPVGVATTIAVLLHEIPQEIGDFGVLIHAGFSRKKALYANFLGSTLAIIGFILAFMLGEKVINYAPVVLGVTSGTFIYLAGSDLVPELHKAKDPKRSLIQLLAMMAGIFLMYLLLFIE